MGLQRSGNVLITDYNGTPTSTYGEGFKAHLLTQSPLVTP